MNVVWLYWENYPGKTMPAFIAMCHEAVHKYCPEGYEVVLVGPENIHEYLPNIREDLDVIRREGSDVVPNIPIKTAYIRVALLYEYGGIWIDSDMVPINSFDGVKTLLKHFNFVGYRHWAGHIVNNFLASTPKGSIITKYKTALDSLLDNNKTLPWGLAGARTITPIITKSGDGYTLYRDADFHPIPWYDKDLFFKPGTIDKYINESTLCVALFNDIFPENFKQWSRKEIMNSNLLISDVFKKALRGDINNE